MDVITVRVGFFPGKMTDWTIEAGSTVGQLRDLVSSDYDFDGYTLKTNGNQVVNDDTVLIDGNNYYGVKEIKANQ